MLTDTEQKTISPADSGVRAEDYSAPIWSHPRVIVIASAVLVFAACYTRGFILPNTPISLWGDHVGFFNDGSYIVAGDLPFRDYFQIVPPGTDLVYALLIKLFGIRIWIPNLLIALVAGIAALLMTSIALRVIRGWLAILPAILLAGPVLHSSMDPTHHWFSTLAMLAAVLTLSKETTNARVALAGAWCGVAMCFTQTKGLAAVAGFAVYLSLVAGRRCWRSRMVLGGSAAALFAAVNAYFIYSAGFSRWIYCLLVYPARYYPAPDINNWHVLLQQTKLFAGTTSPWLVGGFLYIAVPAAYIGFALVARRKWNAREEAWRTLALLAIAGVAMLLAVGSAPSLKRVAIASPPAMILLVWLLSRMGTLRRAAVLLTAIGSVSLALLIAVKVQTGWNADLMLPSGRVAIPSPAFYEEYAWTLENVHPGEYYFGMPPFFYSFHLRRASAIQGFESTEYTRPEQVAALVRGLEERQVRVVVVYRSGEFLAAKFGPGDHRAPIREYLISHYRLEKSFADGDDVWMRK